MRNQGMEKCTAPLQGHFGFKLFIAPRCKPGQPQSQDEDIALSKDPSTFVTEDFYKSDFLNEEEVCLGWCGVGDKVWLQFW